MILHAARGTSSTQHPTTAKLSTTLVAQAPSRSVFRPASGESTLPRLPMLRLNREQFIDMSMRPEEARSEIRSEWQEF